MRFRLILLAAPLLIPLSALGISYVYTGVGGDGLPAVSTFCRLEPASGQTGTIDASNPCRS